MLFILKNVVLGMLFWFALTLPGSAESAEVVYRIVTFKVDLKEAMKDDEHWKACGDYFAYAESEEGKIIHFNFERKSAGKLSTVFAFSKIERVVVTIEERARVPTVSIVGNRPDALFLISMNVKDYMSGLPCLAKGTKI